MLDERDLKANLKGVKCLPFFLSLKIPSSFMVVCFCGTSTHTFSLFLGCRHAILAHTLEPSFL